MAVRYVPDREGQRKLRQAVGLGLLNYLYRAEGAAKRNAPVRGGDRSFNPDQPIGGTLRRSIHAVVYVDGQRVSEASIDENKEPLPDYGIDAAIVGVLGTNCDYGLYVHNGTVRMPARPFFAEAIAQTRGEAPGLIRQGIKGAL